MDDLLMRTREEEWQVLLQEYKPPHPPNSPFTKEMWQLVSAAYESPTFRALYPVISLWSLSVSDADSFADPADRFPAIAAGKSEYRVLAWPYSREVILFLTSDPAEAIEFTADLIEEGRKHAPITPTA
jgi:hypothetical protein